MAELRPKDPKYCKLCGGLCITTGERTLRLCYACGMRAEKRQRAETRKPGYGFRHV